jgi:hypothetical protein
MNNMEIILLAIIGLTVLDVVLRSLGVKYPWAGTRDKR